MSIFRRKDVLPYTEDNIAEQLGAIGLLMKYREKALQLATATRSDVKQQGYLEEVAMHTDNLDIANKVLGYMLELDEQVLRRSLQSRRAKRRIKKQEAKR